MGFTLTYELEGAGWATARIQDGDSHMDVTVSYLHDSLRELAEAACALLSGAHSARVVFMDEPGEIHLVLDRVDDVLRCEARWFEDWSSWGMHPADRFKVVFSGVTTVHRFVGEVRKELEALLREHGLSGYKAKWVEHDFPDDLLSELRQVTKTEPCAAPNGGPATQCGNSGVTEGPPSVS
jgi:hypothetical protein